WCLLKTCMNVCLLFLESQKLLTYLFLQVATYIINRMITTEEGMRYCSDPPGRFYAIRHAMRDMVEELVGGGRLAEHSPRRLLKHIIWCYERFSQYSWACYGLCYSFPNLLEDPPICNNIFQGDDTALGWLEELRQNVRNAKEHNIQGLRPGLDPVFKGKTRGLAIQRPREDWS
ncbi:hypothetical protein Tsubulata_049463, partial [Turnera subulata]